MAMTMTFRPVRSLQNTFVTSLAFRPIKDYGRNVYYEEEKSPVTTKASAGPEPSGDADISPASFIFSVYNR